MNELNIKKVKLAKVKDGDGLDVDLTKKDPDGTKVSVSENHKGLIHQDLRAAFRTLGLHLAIMTGYVKSTEVADIKKPDPELAEAFHVNGISLGGDDDNPGVVISGHYTLPGSGKAVILNTPFARFNEGAETRYVFMDDLENKLQVIDSEVRSYLAGTKRGAPAQLSMDMTETNTSEDEPITEEGKLAPKDSKHKYARKGAMKRVAEADQEDKS